MNRKRWPRLILMAAWLLGSGCTALREVPRTDYAAMPERKHVRIETDEGLVYELDSVHVSNDSLVGYRRLDVSGPVEEYATIGVPLANVKRLSTRGVDWYRTGLIGGGVLAAVVAAGLSAAGGGSSSPDPSGGGPGGRVP
jgi:hypothetical protein